jgi:mono/diheme cytochrome c family protein
MVLVMSAAIAASAGCGGGGGDDDADNGEAEAAANAAQQLYIDKGCPECHGDNAEGDGDNPRTTLAGTRMIIQQFTQRIRNGRGSAKPPMGPEQITDDEIKTIHAWLKELPAD